MFCRSQVILYLIFFFIFCTSTYSAVLPKDKSNIWFSLIPFKGTVKDSFTDKPVSSAVVSVYWRQIKITRKNDDTAQESKIVVAEAYTNENGEFQISGQDNIHIDAGWSWDKNDIPVISVFKNGYYHKTVNAKANAILAQLKPKNITITIDRIATSYYEYKNYPQWIDELLYMKSYIRAGIPEYYLSRSASKRIHYSARANSHYKGIVKLINDNCRAAWMTPENKKKVCIDPYSKLGAMLGYSLPSQVELIIKANKNTQFYKNYHQYIKYNKTEKVVLDPNSNVTVSMPVAKGK